MQRLISSLAIVSLSLFPSSVLAQHQFGGEYYHNNYWQNQGGGDTVRYNGLVLTNNLPPNTDTCVWVREVARLPCEYFYEQRNSTGYTTHYVGRPRPRRNNQNTHQWQNPGWNGGGGCVYQNKHVRILCN